jgi:hypothetical protein
MKTPVTFTTVILVLCITLLSSYNKSEKGKSTIREENITYVADGVTMMGKIALAVQWY